MMNYFGTVFPHFSLSCRLESQMTADIQTILQLLQKQTTVVPPAYSMVTAGTEYQRPTIHLMRTSHLRASIKTDRSFSPSSQVSVDRVQKCVLGTTWIKTTWGAGENADSHSVNGPCKPQFTYLHPSPAPTHAILMPIKSLRTMDLEDWF